MATCDAVEGMEEGLEGGPAACGVDEAEVLAQGPVELLPECVCVELGLGFVEPALGEEAA